MSVVFVLCGVWYVCVCVYGVCVVSMVWCGMVWCGVCDMFV